MNNIPVTLFRDLPVYTGSLPADGIQVVAVYNNTNTYRVPLESLTGSMAVVAPRTPEAPDDDVQGDLAWGDGELYVNTPSGWQKSALYSYGDWADIVPGTRFLRVDDTMELDASEVQNVLDTLGIAEATSTNRGVVYVASSMDDGDRKAATVGLVKDYVSGVTERVEELYVDMQAVSDHVDGVKVSVDGSLARVVDAETAITNVKTYVTATESRIAALDTHVALNADRAELAAQRAEAAADSFPGFDSVPVEGSMNAVRSGGIKEWGDSRFLQLSHAADIEAGEFSIHVSQEDRERWDSYSEAGISPEERTALDNLVAGDIIGGNVRIGAADGETVLWIRKSGDGTNDLSVTADEVSVTATGGLLVNGSALVSGGVAVSGLITAGGEQVVTVGDEGSFPASGSAAVDGYATVQDAVDYINLVRADILANVAERYIPAVTTDFATIGGDNTFTGTNRFTLHPVYVESVEASSGIVLQPAGADDPTIALTASSGLVEASILDLGGSATVGGSLAVEGETTIGSALTVGGYTSLSDGLEVAEDLHVDGVSLLAGDIAAGSDLTVEGDTVLRGTLDIDGVTVFGDRIDSDVVIGHGPIGKVNAQADLHIGDPSAPGTIRYNGYTYTVDAGVPTQSAGQVELVNPMVPCVITIGDNDPLYIEPERASLSQPMVALVSAPAAYTSLGAGVGTAASVTVGPSALDPSSSAQDYSLVGRYASIDLYYNGEKIYEFPSTYRWNAGSMIYGEHSLCNIWTGLDPEQAQAGITSPAIQYMLGASMLVAPRIPEGATVPYFNEVQVSLYARHGGASGNVFSVAATGASSGTPGAVTKTKSIPETHLSGGGGAQEAVCAIGVLRAKDKSTGNYRLVREGDLANRQVGDKIIYWKAGSYIRAYIGSALVIDQPMAGHTEADTFSELCTYIPGLLASIMPIEMYLVDQGWGAATVDPGYTLHCKAVNAGAEGNDLRIEMYTGDTSAIGNYAEYFKIDMFGGVDGVDPGSDSDSDTGSSSGSKSASTSSSDVPVVHPLTPQQIADLISTLPDYTGSVHETGSNLVDITAKLPGARFNADTYAAGGVDVVTPVSGGSDDRDAGGLAELLNDVDIFDVSAEVVYPDVVELTAKQAGSYNNDKPIECTGCFGTGTVLMGSKTAGADGVDPTYYNLVLNGEYILPGGEPFDGHLEADLHVGHEGTVFKIYLNGEEFKGGGMVDLDPEPVEGSDTTAVSSGGVYDTVFVRGEEVPPTVVSKATTGSGEVNAYNTDKYAKIGLYHTGGLVGKLVKVKMKNSSDGNIYNVHLQVSYDETFQDSTTRLSYDKIDATGDHLLEWLEWNFDDPLELTGDKPLYVRWRKPDVTAEDVYTYSRKYSTIDADDDSFTTHDGVFERNVPLCELFVETVPGHVEKVWAGPELAAHEGDASAHLDSFERELVNNLGAGWLWYPNRTGSVTVMPDTSGAPNGIAIQATNAYGRIEIQDYGVVITSPNRPQWLEASLEAYAFHDILTTKDVDPESIPAVAARVTTLENTTVPAVSNRVTTLENTTVPAVANRVTALEALVPLSDLLQWRNESVDSVGYAGASAASVFVCTGGTGVIRDTGNIQAGKARLGTFWTDRLAGYKVRSIALKAQVKTGGTGHSNCKLRVGPDDNLDGTSGTFRESVNSVADTGSDGRWSVWTFDTVNNPFVVQAGAPVYLGIVPGGSTNSIMSRLAYYSKYAGDSDSGWKYGGAWSNDRVLVARVEVVP